MPLRSLFLDMNAFFASVEQQLRPELRHRPIAVAAVNVDTSCCIAVSYEARKFGVKTLTPIWQAKLLCKSIQIVESRPCVYVEMHHKIIQAVETCLPVERILSIDEMSCRLSDAEREAAPAIELALRVKDAVRRIAGEHLKCTVGLAPNRFLAKVATDMQKPDGLVVINEEDLPHILYKLKLTDLPGIGEKMLARLQRHGIGTVKQLCDASKDHLSDAWNGVVGAHWWHLLRGHDWNDPPSHRRTIGHSHVLSPARRNDQDARAILIRLITKAAIRLRDMNLWARRMKIHVAYSFRSKGWKTSIHLGLCQDTLSMIEAFCKAWHSRPKNTSPTKVAVTLYQLIDDRNASLPLFSADCKRLRLSRAIDALNSKHGLNKVYFAAMHSALNSAPMHIAFNRIPDLRLEA